MTRYNSVSIMHSPPSTTPPTRQTYFYLRCTLPYLHLDIYRTLSGRCWLLSSDSWTVSRSEVQRSLLQDQEYLLLAVAAAQIGL